MDKRLAKGRFFAFEGIDGCGKSTQAQKLLQRLGENGIQASLFREPGGSKISESIRSLLLNPDFSSMTPGTELLLYTASRAQLMAEVVGPALDRGNYLVGDRSPWATYAYQGYGRGLSLELIDGLQRFACGPHWPSCTLYLDIPVDLMAERLGKTGSKPDRMESEGDGFFEEVRQGYLALAEKHPDEIKVVDGTRPVEEIHHLIWAQLEPQIRKASRNL